MKFSGNHTRIVCIYLAILTVAAAPNSHVRDFSAYSDLSHAGDDDKH
jgi:hypothetical protein